MLFLRYFVVLFCVILVSSCSFVGRNYTSVAGPNFETAKLTPRASTYRDLISLPKPRGKIAAAVYNFRDQTGQYKSAPSSSFSTSVTQGASAMLVNAMNDSGWFIPLEREGLQNILTERKIIRAAQKKPNAPANNDDELPSLLASNILLEGGIIAYDSNIKTGGAGAKYFGIGASEQYRIDQVTINLRAIDIRSGRILHSVLTTKSILSKEVQSGVFRFIEFKKLLEVEIGTTSNEPAQLCVLSAIEAALIHLVVDGVDSHLWNLKNPRDINHPTIEKYRREIANNNQAFMEYE